MNKILFTFLFFITNLFAEKLNEPALQDKKIASLQKYCLNHADSWQGFYNLGRTYYEASDFKNAEGNFSNALQKCSDPKQQESIFYNLGNTYFKQFPETQKEQQIPVLEKCIQNYKSALALNPNAEDTKKNLEIAQKILEKLKENQKQQQDKNNQNKKDNQDKKDSSQQKNQQKDNQQDQQNNSNSDEKEEQNEQTQKESSSDKENSQQPKQQNTASTNPEQKEVPQNLKQQEMENILQKEKNNERILPVNFSKNQKISQEKILKDW